MKLEPASSTAKAPATNFTGDVASLYVDADWSTGDVSQWPDLHDHTNNVAVGAEAINTVTVKGKKKVFRGRPGVRSDWKKAIVSLVEGHKIDVTTGL